MSLTWADLRGALVACMTVWAVLVTARVTLLAAFFGPSTIPPYALEVAVATAGLWCAVAAVAYVTLPVASLATRTSMIVLGATGAAAVVVEPFVAWLIVDAGHRGSLSVYYAQRGPRNVAIAIAVVAAGLAVRMARRAHRAAAARRDARAAATRAANSVRAAQLHPHFLYNSLSAIGEAFHAAPARGVDLARMLQRLAQRAADLDTDASITLREELALSAAYIELQRARFGEGLRFDLEYDEAMLDVSVPPFILQPLVENAITHGLRGCRGVGRVRVEVSMSAGALRVLVTDTGGVSGARPIRLGTGLLGVRARLHVHSEAAELRVFQRPTGGIAAEILVPRSRSATGSEARRARLVPDAGGTAGNWEAAPRWTLLLLVATVLPVVAVLIALADRSIAVEVGPAWRAAQPVVLRSVADITGVAVAALVGWRLAALRVVPSNWTWFAPVGIFVIAHALAVVLVLGAARLGAFPASANTLSGLLYVRTAFLGTTAGFASLAAMGARWSSRAASDSRETLELDRTVADSLAARDLVRETYAVLAAHLELIARTAERTGIDAGPGIERALDHLAAALRALQVPALEVATAKRRAAAELAALSAALGDVTARAGAG